MTKNMTTGSPVQLIIGFAIPMFLGMLFQQFYSMVDTMIVGQYQSHRCSERMTSVGLEDL